MSAHHIDTRQTHSGWNDTVRKFGAFCSCGWYGSQWPTRTLAQDDGDKHVETESGER